MENEKGKEIPADKLLDFIFQLQSVNEYTVIFEKNFEVTKEFLEELGYVIPGSWGCLD